MPQTPINARRSINTKILAKRATVGLAQQGRSYESGGRPPRKKVIRKHQRSERARPPVGPRMTFFPAVRSTFSNGSRSNTTISGHTKTVWWFIGLPGGSSTRPPVFSVGALSKVELDFFHCSVLDPFSGWTGPKDLLVGHRLVCLGIPASRFPGHSMKRDQRKEVRSF
jgi:hypothetical protein